MDFNRYTTKAAEAIQETMKLSGKLSHQAIAPWHLLYSLVSQSDGLVPQLLNKLEKDPQTVLSEVQSQLNKIPRVTGDTSAYLTSESKKILDQAETEASQLRDEYISTEHLFFSTS